MRALRLNERGQLVLERVPVPQAGPGQARVKVRLAGICSTDLQLTRGYKGGFVGTLGHEFVGEVDQCPEAPEWIGRRVVSEINIGCGHCRWCRRGDQGHCPSRRVLGIIDHDGCFAPWIVVPIGRLHQVPDILSDRQAVFVEPTAAALRILEQVHVRPGLRVAVLGDGKLGQLVTQALLAGTQGSITLVGRHPAKLALAAQRGAHTLLATHAVPGAQRFDIVVEATGTQEGLAEALAWVEPMGTVVLKSTFHGLASVDVSQVVVSEVTLVGSRCGPFAPAIEALSSGAIDPEPLIADVFDLAEGQAAFERASQRGVLKVLMAPREWS